MLQARDDDKNVVTVILGNSSLENNRKDFHCLKCGKIVFQYYTEDRIMIIMGEMREVARPIDIQCWNHKCKLIHRIA